MNWKRFYFDVRTLCWFITAFLLGGAFLAIVYMSLVNAIAYILTGFACLGTGVVIGMAFKVRLDPPIVPEEIEPDINVPDMEEADIALHHLPPYEELQAALVALTDAAIDRDDCRCRYCGMADARLAGDLAYDPKVHRQGEHRCLIPGSRLLVRSIKIASPST